MSLINLLTIRNCESFSVMWNTRQNIVFHLFPLSILVRLSRHPLFPFTIEHIFYFNPFLECNEAAVFVVTHHGGHLGFYEGGLITVSPLTWLDRAVMQYIMAVIQVKRSKKESFSFEQAENYVIAS